MMTPLGPERPRSSVSHHVHIDLPLVCAEDSRTGRTAVGDCQLDRVVTPTQLLFQMWLHCLSKVAHSLVRDT